MRKSFKGRYCAYCGDQLATTDDHVIGKGFLPVPLRGNLPIVPACKSCNNRKSELERYAMAVLPFGSRHAAGAEMLRTKVRSRLENDMPLYRELQQGQIDVGGLKSDGSFTGTFGVPINPDKSLNLFEMIIRGLVCHHSGSPLPSSYTLRLVSLTDYRLDLFKEHILSRRLEEFQDVPLAEGAFAYQFTRGADDPFFSVWILDIYNSLNMVGFAEDGCLVRINIAALSGPHEKVDQIIETYREYVKDQQSS